MKYLPCVSELAVAVLLVTSSLVSASPQIGDHEVTQYQFQARDIKCGNPDAVNTTERLASLRSLMRANSIEVYIITSNDAHQVQAYFRNYQGAESV